MKTPNILQIILHHLQCVPGLSQCSYTTSWHLGISNFETKLNSLKGKEKSGDHLISLRKKKGNEYSLDKYQDNNKCQRRHRQLKRKFWRYLYCKTKTNRSTRVWWRGQGCRDKNNNKCKRRHRQQKVLGVVAGKCKRRHRQWRILVVVSRQRQWKAPEDGGDVWVAEAEKAGDEDALQRGWHARHNLKEETSSVKMRLDQLDHWPTLRRWSWLEKRQTEHQHY